MDFLVVDPGKFATKAAASNSDALLSFRTKMYKFKDSEDFEPQGNSFKVSYRGESFIVGEQGRDIDFNLSKSGLVHKLTSMVAAGSYFRMGDMVNLVLGCPITLYRNKDTRLNYIDKLTDNKSFACKINDKPFGITFNKVLVLPEGSGAPYAYPGIFKDNMVCVIDVGGLNTNISVFNNFVMDFDKIFTFNHGGFKLESEIISQVQSKYGIVLGPQLAEQAMSNDALIIKGKPDLDSRELFHKIYDNFIDELLEYILGVNINLDVMGVLFIGGTSEFLFDRLKKKVSHAQCADKANYSNVIGFKRVAQIKFAR